MHYRCYSRYRYCLNTLWYNVVNCTWGCFLVCLAILGVFLFVYFDVPMDDPSYSHWSQKKAFARDLSAFHATDKETWVEKNIKDTDIIEYTTQANDAATDDNYADLYVNQAEVKEAWVEKSIKDTNIIDYTTQANDAGTDNNHADLYVNQAEVKEAWEDKSIKDTNIIDYTTQANDAGTDNTSNHADSIVKYAANNGAKLKQEVVKDKDIIEITKPADKANNDNNVYDEKEHRRESKHEENRDTQTETTPSRSPKDLRWDTDRDNNDGEKNDSVRTTIVSVIIKDKLNLVAESLVATKFSKISKETEINNDGSKVADENKKDGKFDYFSVTTETIESIDVNDIDTNEYNIEQGGLEDVLLDVENNSKIDSKGDQSTYLEQNEGKETIYETNGTEQSKDYFEQSLIENENEEINEEALVKQPGIDLEKDSHNEYKHAQEDDYENEVTDYVLIKDETKTEQGKHNTEQSLIKGKKEISYEVAYEKEPVIDGNLEKDNHGENKHDQEDNYEMEVNIDVQTTKRSIVRVTTDVPTPKYDEKEEGGGFQTTTANNVNTDSDDEQESPSVEVRDDITARGLRKLNIIGRTDLLDANRTCSKKLPSVIIIGVMKAGTEAFGTFLAINPQVALSLNVRSTLFFTSKYNRGLRWYREQMMCSSKDQVTIEKAPQYYPNAFAPERIHKMNPNIKLILIVRDPIDRAMSHYLQMKHSHPENLHGASFEQSVLLNGEVNPNSSFVGLSRYAVILKRWLQYFNLKQILIIDGDEFKENQIKSLARAEEFIGVKYYITRNRFALDKTRGVYCIKTGDGPEELACLSDGKGRTHPDIKPDVLHKLKNFYKPYNEQFFKMVGKRFNW